MSVTHFELSNFTAFEQATFEFSPGINVLIGENSTGKTHVLKSLYALLKVCETNQAMQTIDQSKLGNAIASKLLGVLKPDAITRLIRHGQQSAQLIVRDENQQLQFVLTTEGAVSVTTTQLPAATSVLYLPTQEFLSGYEGFIAAYQRRESAFDETYFDLSIALNALPLRVKNGNHSSHLFAQLGMPIIDEVSQENGRFYVRLPEGKLEAHLVAEGLRKLASLKYLIDNGSLQPNGILLWDEPETNLNPRIIPHLAKFLYRLAALNVQIFIATHDFLLSQELSLIGEYVENAQIKFFSLYKPDHSAGVFVESGKTVAELEHNSILKEFADHYDREAELFSV
ncbi:MAG: AAA family ATPase [Caldilineaceae bacterium]